jgi:FkbM family methyltransferase
MLKWLVKKSVEKAGYRIAAAEYEANLVMVEALRRLQPSLVIDVGGNRGQFRDVLRYDVGYSGQIISFEPSPADFEVLQKRAQSDSSWRVFPFAIGSTEETKTFNIMQSSVFNSFHELIPEGHGWAHQQRAEKIDVQVRRLDRVLEELGVDPTGALLKTDTQGFDLEVIRSAPTEKLRAIQFEASQVPIYDGSPDMLDVIREVRDLGFAISALAPLGSVRGQVYEFDCLMVRPPAS